MKSMKHLTVKVGLSLIFWMLYMILLENDSKICILEMSNSGPEWSSLGPELCLQKEPLAT